MKYVQCLVVSANGVISHLASLAVKSTRSVTGKNVRNLRDEFQLDPLLFHNKKFFVAKTEIPQNSVVGFFGRLDEAFDISILE